MKALLDPSKSESAALIRRLARSGMAPKEIAERCELQIRYVHQIVKDIEPKSEKFVPATQVKPDKPRGYRPAQIAWAIQNMNNSVNSKEALMILLMEKEGLLFVRDGGFVR